MTEAKTETETDMSRPTLGGHLNRARSDRTAAPVSDTATDSADTTPELQQTVARGTSAATPFVLLGGVAFAVWSAAAVLGLAALLIWWLA